MLILKQWISLLLAALVPLSAIAPAAANDTPKVSAKSAVVMSENGDLLFAHDEDLLLPMASTTKLMTALLVAERRDLDEKIEIDAAWCGLEGSSMYLRPGQLYTIRELLTGLLLVSGNDAARALACITAGDELSFAALMNDRAATLGMSRSHFMNPHGLNEPEHYSTAHDLADEYGYQFVALEGNPPNLTVPDTTTTTTAATTTTTTTTFTTTTTPAVTTTALTGECGAEGSNVTWTLADGVLTISGKGAMKDYSDSKRTPSY